VLAVTIANQAGTFQNSPSDSSILGSAVQSGGISGTFTVTNQANNRGTLAMSSGRMAGSGSGVFYFVSDTEVIVLGNDATNTDPQLIVFDE
jgi:glutamate synthase domain-containing protein 3